MSETNRYKFKKTLTITKGGLELLTSATKYLDFSHHSYHLNYNNIKDKHFINLKYNEHKDEINTHDFSTAVGLYCFAICRAIRFFSPIGVSGST